MLKVTPGADGADGQDGVSVQGEPGVQGRYTISVYIRLAKNAATPPVPSATGFNPLEGERGTLTNLTPNWHLSYGEAAGVRFQSC